MTSVMNGMCRCCATEGVYKDIKTSYTWMGEEEVYADMLRECFDLCLSTSEGVEDGGICEVCITQLRNAANFKKQVQNTEEQFKKLALNKLFKPNIVKVEADEEDAGNDSDDNNASADESYSGPEYEVPIKTETEDPKPRKRAVTPRAAKASTSRAKKSKADNGEPSTKRPHGVIIVVKAEEKITKNMKNNKLKSLTSDSPPVQTVRRELQKQRSNIKEVLRWSNATPIRRYGDMGYMCCWCEEQFPKPADLKNHTLESHRNLDNACFMKFNMDNLIVRLDITTLQCKICIKDLDSLDQLLKHLKTDHERPIYDIQNRITPLKFETDMFQCCICNNIVSKFKVLLEHMHLHYRYYICKICDSGYACKRNLRLHMNGHKIGTFKCDHCSQIFDTVVKKKSHERSVHAQKRAYKCGYCHETFTELKIKEAHLAAIHGVVLPKAECQVCLKVFDDRAQLNMHIRRDHLLERTHQCTECGKCFFYSTHLKRHMVKHTGVRAFKCNVCSKCFISTSSLKEHMKIHNNDKRFKCAHCGQAFVQKCSWKLHMRSKHQQIV